MQIVTSSEGNNGEMSANGEKNRSVVSGQYFYWRYYYYPRAFFFPKLLTLDIDAICFIILLDFYGVKSLRI